MDESRDAITGERIEIIGFPKPEVHNYTCVRCKYSYFTKHEDREPYLCYVCMRYIAKRVWVTIHTIRPPLVRPIPPEV